MNRFSAGLLPFPSITKVVYQVGLCGEVNGAEGFAGFDEVLMVSGLERPVVCSLKY